MKNWIKFHILFFSSLTKLIPKIRSQCTVILKSCHYICWEPTQKIMSITNESELIGMQKASEAVAYTLNEMRNFAKAGISTKELDNFGGKILDEMGAKSAPFLTYGFPGYTCIHTFIHFQNFFVYFQI